MAAPGKMLAKDFEYEQQLGTGAFSKVVIGVYKPTGVRYAVKLISKRTILNAPSDEERTRMAEVAKRETRMLLMCEHPNIVKFFASMQTPEDLVFVTELCSGGELQHIIRDLGRVPLEAARVAIAELFSTVFYLHSAPKKTLPINPSAPLKAVTILHRDIKPENVMMSEDMHVKLIDFGTAVACDSVNDKPAGEGGNGKGRAQTFCGTTYYMSPELLEDSYTCCASDYWGCGCVLYHMLTGKRPFDAPTQYLLIKVILEQEPDYPAFMDPLAVDLIKRLLVKSPDRRISMDDIRKHPFFACVNFDELHTMNVKPLWVRDAPWIDETTVDKCSGCTKSFGTFTPKNYCRNCGKIFCGDCVRHEAQLPYPRHPGPQKVCDPCFKMLAS